MKKINSILAGVLEKINPSKEELRDIKISLDEFLKNFEKRIKELNIDAEIFVGGSFAKNTMIKKDHYDIDIFIRFNKKYGNNEISHLTEKLIKNFKNVSLIHGSRDYFQIKIRENFFIEVIPVLKNRKPEQAENITDLSYSHVKYINKKIKSQKILDDIKIAKAFCYANQCYGAESYINGFSGYALELLVYYYKSFLKFIKSMEKIDKKTIIDIEKLHKNKQAIMMDLNSSKLQSPIILIDPTYKQRNALAALSDETFKKFQKTCKEFLKKPSIEAFEIKKTDLEKIKKHAQKKNNEFILLEADTNKQSGDIAGSKLLKFYRHLEKEITQFFKIKNKGFNYNKEKSARYFFVVKAKQDILVKGPNIGDEKNVKAFKKKHQIYFMKKKKIYSKEKIDFGIREFIKDWNSKNKKKVKEMYITKLEVID